jgi:cephalosporin-C deacetylase-like acetyl esterase
MRFIKVFTAFMTMLALSHLSHASTTKTPDWSRPHCPSPKLESRQTISTNNALTEDVTFKGCQGNLISAYLVSPLTPKHKKHPAILYVHWYEPRAVNSNRDEFLAEAKRMAQRGVVSLLVSTFWSVPGGNYHERRWQDDYQNTLNQTQDLLHAVNLLGSMSNKVDTTRIAYVGHDYGATFGAIIAGIDTKIKGFALEAGTPRITAWYMYGSASGVPKGDEATQFLGSFKAIEPDVMIAKTKAKVLLQYANDDEFITQSNAQEMQKAAPKDTVFKTYHTTHAMDLPQIEADRIDWLVHLFHLKLNH